MKTFFELLADLFALILIGVLFGLLAVPYVGWYMGVE